MIRYRKTAKICNICHREVAILKGLRFETVIDYVTLRGDSRSLLHHTERDDVHICYPCWGRMQDVVRAELKGK